jgi:DNA-binding MarR family transcriptional regulator
MDQLKPALSGDQLIDPSTGGCLPFAKIFELEKEFTLFFPSCLSSEREAYRQWKSVNCVQPAEKRSAREPAPTKKGLPILPSWNEEDLRKIHANAFSDGQDSHWQSKGNSLAFLMSSASNNSLGILAVYQAMRGLTSVQRDVLTALGVRAALRGTFTPVLVDGQARSIYTPDLRISGTELATKLNCTTGTVSRAVNHLHRLGLIRGRLTSGKLVSRSGIGGAKWSRYDLSLVKLQAPALKDLQMSWSDFPVSTVLANFIANLPDTNWITSSAKTLSMGLLGSILERLSIMSEDVLRKGGSITPESQASIKALRQRMLCLVNDL